MVRIVSTKPARWSAACLVIASGAAILASRAGAFNPQPEPPGRWGLFGISEGQTARLSVVNISGDPNGFTAGPCRVALAFVDASGTVLKSTQVSLRPGQSTSIEYGFQAPAEPERSDALSVAGDRLGRQDLRARTDIVNFAAPPDPERGRSVPPGPCVPTVDVFETATGRTAFTVAEARMGWGPNHNGTLVRDTGE
jgi:hypothetical protein